MRDNATKLAQKLNELGFNHGPVAAEDGGEPITFERYLRSGAFAVNWGDDTYLDGGIFPTEDVVITLSDGGCVTWFDGTWSPNR